MIFSSEVYLLTPNRLSNTHKTNQKDPICRPPPKLSLLETAIIKAGDVALNYFDKPIDIEIKPDGSQVSEADYAVNATLETELKALDPEIAWLSEESPIDPDRQKASRIWIIDPIDGTSSYLQGAKDWTVVAALIENNQPILGAVYNPIRSELFLAQKGKGATLNGQPICCSDTTELKDASIITSKGHFKRTFQDVGPHPSYKWRCSMAYRIALVASGQVDATISLTPKSDWDIAAAHLILEEANGSMGTPDGKPISYNNSELRHRGIVAATNTLYTSIINKTVNARPPQKS